MFPFLGPEIIEWLLNWYAPQEDQQHSSLTDRLISGSGTEDETIRTRDGTMTRSTDATERNE
jgi:hypothetical protein